MAFDPRLFWSCCVLLAAIGCEKPTATQTADRKIVTSMDTEDPTKDVRPEDDVQTAWELKEENAETELQFDQPLLPLRNFPVVLETTFGNRDAVLTVKNVGDSTLIFGGGGLPNEPMMIDQHHEFEQGGYWIRPKDKWNCMPLPKFELAPKKTATLRVTFSGSEERERVLAFFRQKGTRRACRVVLATEPEF
ncbi:MAG: hypothetical protein ACI92S_000413 [Planctomycetaceae bacterium]|jgi:hypothetical protein